jgi:hypothetical protein
MGTRPGISEDPEPASPIMARAWSRVGRRTTPVREDDIYCGALEDEVLVSSGRDSSLIGVYPRASLHRGDSR